MKWIVVIIILFVLLLGGCAEKVCQTNRDCDDDKACTTDKCIDKGKECTHKKVPGCTCGDGKCDSARGENECTCDDDCGSCRGSEGKYLTKQCIDEQCVLDAKPGLTEKKELTDEIDQRNYQLRATYSYDQPFNIDKSMFNVQLQLDATNDDVEEVRINQIEVVQKLDRRGQEVLVLGKKRVDKTLWSTSTVLNENVILDNLPINGSDLELTATVRITMEYVSSRSTSDKLLTDTHEKTITEEMIFLDPTTKRACPSDCDDGNACTVDSCSSSTQFFCTHEYVRYACCGNNVCDLNENECTCEEDCGLCSGLIGTYMRYGCLDNTCVSLLKDPDKIITRTKVDDRSASDLSFQVKITYDEPANINTSGFHINFELSKLGSGVSNVVFKKIQLLDNKNELISEKNVNLPIQTLGQTFSEVLYPSFQMKDVEEDRYIMVKMFYNYKKLTRPDSPPVDYINQLYQLSIGQIVFVDPGVSQ